jgi:phosphatidylserine/phosphatidylglycerophosphate/cardiolipin synthase-like enzyme
MKLQTIRRARAKLLFKNTQRLIRVLILLVLCVLLGACRLSPSRVQEVDQRVANARQQALSCAPGELDRCSKFSPIMTLAAENQRLERNHLLLLETGEDALKIRVHLIRAAKHSVELQNFILRADDSGKLVLNELLDAARRGVKVRLLLDQMFTDADLNYLVQLTMAHTNFEIRFFNPTFHKAKMAKHDWINGVACCFRRINQRMHNKLLVIDGLVGIIGGRNIADRYFDLDTSYNFKDRDVAVYGPKSVDMQESFELFWNSPKSIEVQHLRDVAKRLLSSPPGSLESFSVDPRLLGMLEQIKDETHIEERFISPAFEVERLEYFSDLPRKQAAPGAAQSLDITAELNQVLTSARDSVLIQSPYMVLSRSARHLFADLRKQNPDIELVFSTNSLASTDGDTVYGNTHKQKKRYVKKLGFHMYEFKPFPADAPDFFPRWPELIAEKKAGIRSKSVVSGDGSTINMLAPRVGLHSKSFVVDGEVAMVGSHNFDPRSEGFNTENGLIVWDADFARALEALIRRDIEPQNSWVVAMLPDDDVPLAENVPVNHTALDSTSFARGPTSVFELIPGHEPVPPDSPDFYRNYYPIGSFPEVVRTRRQYLVLFLGSIFGFLEPIL